MAKNTTSGSTGHLDIPPSEIRPIAVDLNGVTPLISEQIVPGKKEAAPKSPTIIIRTPQIGLIDIPIVGIEPLIIHAWSEKAKRQMLENQMKEAGTKAKSHREKRDPHGDYNGARYIFRDENNEWDGIPAVAFKASLVEACRQVDGLPMTEARRALFVRYQGMTEYHSPLSCKTRIGLVRIWGTPEMREDAVRINDGKDTNLAYRPQYWPWSARLQIEFNSSKFKSDAIANLVATAGYWEGVGEWRPGSKKSNSGQLGRWKIDESQGVTASE